MNVIEARKAIKKNYKAHAKDMLFDFDYWVSTDIDDTDIKNFFKDKILWNMGKIKQSKSQINRLIAFQYACEVQGLHDHARNVEMALADNIVRQYRNNPTAEYEDIKI